MIAREIMLKPLIIVDCSRNLKIDGLYAMSVTMKELARLAGVSRQAVSATFNQSSHSRVSPKTREKILRLSKLIDFVPNQAARQLNGIRNHLIGITAIPRNSGIGIVLQMEIATLLQQHGYGILTESIALDAFDPKSGLNEFRMRRVEGVMAFSVPAPFEQPKSSAVPIVYCSAHNLGRGFDIETDRFNGGYIAAEHLLQHGRKKPVFLALNEEGSYNQEKFNGFRKALQEHGLKITKDDFLTCEKSPSAAKMAEHLRKLKPDAILCANDYIAAKMIIALQKIACRVPEDIAIIGFDGYAFCDFTPVSLTTVVQPIKEQAEMAVNLLFERIKNKETQCKFANLKLKPILRLAASCGCKPSIPDKMDDADRILVPDK